MKSHLSTITAVSTVLSFSSLLFWGYTSLPSNSISYKNQAASADATSSAPRIEKKIATHIPTPDAVRGIYMTACIAGEKRLRENILKTMEGTEINSLVIDLKDFTGTVSYSSTSVVDVNGVSAAKIGHGCRIYDLPEFIEELHSKNIYTIARLTTFQDPLYTSLHPDVAIQSISKPGHPWTDKNGLAYVDPDRSSYWDYILSVGKEAYAIGFDELNFDYIRFPSDGNMKDAQFRIPKGETKADVVSGFWAFLHEKLAELNIPFSGDIFGQTTINRDDMGIGQVFENAIKHFDYVDPMTYPSHFINGFMGFEKPAQHPYEIIKGTMVAAVERAVAASSSPLKIRPWLQAFDLGAIYTPDMVHKQIQAVYDSGLTSWILWDAANRYTKAEL